MGFAMGMGIVDGDGVRVGDWDWNWRLGLGLAPVEESGVSTRCALNPRVPFRGQAPRLTGARQLSVGSTRALLSRWKVNVSSPVGRQTCAIHRGVRTGEDFGGRVVDSTHVVTGLSGRSDNILHRQRSECPKESTHVGSLRPPHGPLLLSWTKSQALSRVLRVRSGE